MEHVTHAQRVIDAASGLTKGDLVAYFDRVAPLMLPHLRGRPVALLRAPAGVGGPFFFQKHAGEGELPELTRLDASIDPAHEPHLSINGRGALLAAARMNVVEFHTWNATVRAIDRPDRVVFDLDPGEGVGWSALREAARLLRGELDGLRLGAFVKTSGGKGLHVVVPLVPRAGWDEVRGFARALVERLAQRMPERFVARSGASHRVGRIFIDYLRNGFGATTVCAWSARARPGLAVSVPIAWEELDGIGGSDHWRVADVAARLETGNAPWSGYAAARRALGPALRALQADGSADGASEPGDDAPRSDARSEPRRSGRPRRAPAEARHASREGTT